MEELSSLEIILIAFFMLMPVLRIHAIGVLWQVREEIKHKNLGLEKKFGLGIITEKLIVAVAGTFGSILIALAGINRVLVLSGGEPLYPQGLTPAVLALALVALSIPAVVWEYMYFTGRLED